ncbi:hypothetical protein ABN028_13335 [Actinopolymorpha sp. B17G11]|uniref:hypothetical protein n=1 Tax=unclassified Actinopolymorpha TaxID=2627063 RepID=UPI0032D8D8A7
MRTTVTLDDDVAAGLRQFAREHGISFKEAVNAAVRRGLAPRQRSQEPYELPSFALEVRPGINLDKAGALASDLEDEAIFAKLELRK